VLLPIIPIDRCAGGGTGSGLGTYVLSLLADEYPEVYRSVSPVLQETRRFGYGAHSASLRDTKALLCLLDRFTNSVFPSEDDDVVTSPYNSVAIPTVLAARGCSSVRTDKAGRMPPGLCWTGS